MLIYVVVGEFMEDGNLTVGNVLVTADRDKAYSSKKDNFENCLCLSVETWEDEQFVNDEEIDQPVVENTEAVATDETNNIRYNLIKHIRDLYNRGLITNQYNYNIHNNTLNFLIEYLQDKHSHIKNVEEINRNILWQFLKFLREDRTQKQFLSIHLDVINMEFKAEISMRDLK